MNEQTIVFFVNDGSNPIAYNKDSSDELRLLKHADCVVVFDVVSVSGVPIDLTGKTVSILVKKRPTDTINVAKIDSSQLDIPSKSSGKFLFPKQLWEYANPGLYVYSVLSVDTLGETVVISPTRILHLGM